MPRSNVHPTTMDQDITQIINAAADGDPQASATILPLVYDRLRRLAAHKMAREAPGNTLQATALVHEAWLRLAGQEEGQWQNRNHFFNVAAEAMRRILVDRARRRKAAKRGGEAEHLELDKIEAPDNRSDSFLLDVHEALDQLAQEDATAAEVVKLRFFVGLKNHEISNLLGKSDKTVRRHWSFAKARLVQIIDECPDRDKSISDLAD